jgi:hypothetical protein
LSTPFASATAASATLRVAGTGVPGTTLTVLGTNFSPRQWIQLSWDGSTQGMPSARVSAAGTFSASITIPADATLGSHLLTGLSTAKKGSRSGVPVPDPLASVTVMVIAAPTPTATTVPTAIPTSAPTAAPTALPTATPTAAPTATPTGTPTAGWVTVVDDQFSAGGVPAHWGLYNGPYGSGPHNCAVPSHDVVSGGYLHLLMSYDTTGICGAGWYTGGMALEGFSAIDERVTVRFRVVSNGILGHRIIPMRWPDLDSSWPTGGEEDYCEGDTLSGCTTFLHYGTSNAQVAHAYAFDLSQWHTVRFERRNHAVTAWVDDTANPVWTYVGSLSTLPDTLKHVVLQQECQSSCPVGTSGTEDIQLDWITVEHPAP